MAANALVANAPVANAKPAAKFASTPTLSFNVAARVAVRNAGRSTVGPLQTFAARVYLKDKRARIETRLSDRPIVFLLAPPYAYKLLPQSKAGVRWRADAQTMRSASSLDVQSVMRNPASLRAALQKAGARKTGSAAMGGVAADIYTARNLGGQRGTARVWLRRSDNLPLRLEATSPSLASVLTWSNYRRGILLSDTLFRAPANYSIRDSVEQPKLF